MPGLTENVLSIREMRRRAPLHFAARAENARFAAFTLSHMARDSHADELEIANYSGARHLALFEAFHREAALALKLILKATVAQKLRNGMALVGVKQVRITHDLEHLWRDAALSAASDEITRVLLFATRTLYWSGRYAAPNLNAEEYDDLRQRRLNDLTRRISRFSGIAIPLWTMSWGDFEAVFKIIWDEFVVARGKEP